jgi:integral membrane protein
VAHTRTHGGATEPDLVSRLWATLTQRGIEGAFQRYKVMAYVVGVGLIILVFVGIPLQFGAGFPLVEQVVGTAHGFLYMVYLVTALDLSLRSRFTLLQMAAMIGAGLLPFLAFVIERKVERRVRDVVAQRAGDVEAVSPSAQ